MKERLPASATQPSAPVVAKAPATTAPQGHPNTNYLYVIGLTGAAAIGGLLFGFDSGVVNGTVAALAAAFGTKAAATGFAVASVLVGCAFGAFGAGALANRIGRRPTMIIDAVLFLGSAFATGASGSVGVFIGSRIAAGLAIGAASVLAPMYIAEVAPAHLRGRLASLQQLAIVLGLFFAFLSNDIIAKLSGGAAATFWLGASAWRWMFWVEALPSPRSCLAHCSFLNRLAFLSSPASKSRPAKFSLGSEAVARNWSRKSRRARRCASPTPVGFDRPRHKSDRPRGLGGSGPGGASAVRRHQYHFLFR